MKQFFDKNERNIDIGIKVAKPIEKKKDRYGFPYLENYKPYYTKPGEKLFEIDEIDSDIENMVFDFDDDER